jgi:membrane associated rhomboid family serine protease
MSEWNRYGLHKGLVLWPILWVATAFIAFVANHGLNLGWNTYGLRPGEYSGLLGILTMPWLHGDWNHLSSNLISLLFVGVLVRYSFPRIFDCIWITSLLLPGLGIWFIGRHNVHIGASAWLYSMVAFVFFSGLIRQHLRLLAQSMLMAFLYGSFFWGILPHDPTISWEGHLSGAAVGLFLALVFRSEEPIQELKNEVIVHEEVEWDDWKLDPQKDEEATPIPPRTPSQPHSRQQFRYEDGSHPDELV